MTSLRLLTFTTSHEEGGAEVHLRSTLEAARARGYHVTVALPGTHQPRACATT